MKIVVIGGTGLIGSKTVAILRQDGHEVVAASPQSGINTITGEGLKEAMVDTTVVIDLANSLLRDLWPQSSRGRGRSGRQTPCRALYHRSRPDARQRLLPCQGSSGKLIEASGIPYTIVRATQFMEFLGTIAARSTDGNLVRLSPGLLQPIAADNVAAILADVVLAAPRDRWPRSSATQRNRRPLFEGRRRTA